MKLPLKAYWNLLAEYIRPQRGRFLLLTVLLLGSIGLKLVNPLIMRGFIDAALTGAALQQLVFAALAFIALALLSQVVAVTVVYLSETLAWLATNELRGDLAEHCLRLDMGFHNTHTPGEMIERLDGDISEMARFFSQFVIVLVGNLLLVAGILTALFIEDWLVGLVFTGFAVLSLLVLGWVRDIAVEQQKVHRQAEADLFGFVEEQLTGTEDVRSSGAVGFSLRELQRLQGGILRADRSARRRGFIIDVAMGSLLTLGTILAVGSGYVLFTAGAITIGTVYLYIYYASLLEVPIWTLIREVQTFQTIGACVERLTELRSLQPASGSDRPGLPASPAPLTPAVPQAARAAALAFDAVSFGYNGSDQVLKNLSFRLAPGEVLGLLGRTGSGKSTLARLIFRLYDPRQGSICLDDLDIRRLGLPQLRQQVAMVTQEVQLFQGSVRDNLTFFDRHIRDEQIRAAITQLGLDDWLRSLPDGLDTRLAGGGRSLSAGEGQLLAFTRVFLRDPALVILDEASARLDPATEQRIERTIDRLLQGRTAIIIAHRLGTLQRAGQVMILEKGVVSEYGSRQALAADPGSRFHALLKTGLEEVLA